MIFIYPALVSENVEKQFVPVVLKSMEKYFAYHISESFKMGIISVDAYEGKPNQWSYTFSSGKESLFKKQSKFKLNDSVLHEDYKSSDADSDVKTIQSYTEYLKRISDDMKNSADEMEIYVTNIRSNASPEESQRYYSDIRQFESEMLVLKKQFDSNINAYKTAKDNFKKLIDGIFTKDKIDTVPGYSGFNDYSQIVDFYNTLNRLDRDVNYYKIQADTSETRFDNAKTEGNNIIATLGSRYKDNPINDLKNIISNEEIENYFTSVNHFVTNVNTRISNIKDSIHDSRVLNLLNEIDKSVQQFDLLTSDDIATLASIVDNFQMKIRQDRKDSDEFFHNLYLEYETIQSTKSDLINRLTRIEATVDPTNKKLANRLLSEIGKLDSLIKSAQDQLQSIQSQYKSFLDNSQSKIDSVNEKMGKDVLDQKDIEELPERDRIKDPVTGKWRKKTPEEINQRDIEELPERDRIKDPVTGKWRKKTPEEIAKDEQDEKVSKAKTMAGGKIEISKDYNVDLQPETTDTQVNIVYHFKNGKMDVDRITIPLGVKISPMTVKNANQMYNLLIDDMTATHFKFLYRAMFRVLLRVKNRWVGKIKRIFNLLNPMRKFDFSPGAMKVDYYNDIVLGDKGFVDASSFKGKSRTASTFKYAAAIVIMDSSDLTEEVNNFLSNPSKVRRLFILGWNTFAVMDNPNQKMIFCSYIEGGTCSELQYSYLFNTGGKGLGKMFENMDTLKQQTMPFRLKRGNVTSWARKFINRQRAEKTVNGKLTKYGV